jgi:N-acetylglucosamine-6-sulfatase
VGAGRPLSFNEKDVSDKPPWIRQLPRLTDRQKRYIDERHERRAESLLAVDDLVEGVVNTLDNAGVLGNTYIFFTSDNGFFEGEHRIPQGKMRPYEEDIRVPLLVDGPRIAASSTTSKLALNTDYLPTFTDLADPTDTVAPPSYVDGRSLLPVLEGSATTWRNAILLEGARYGDAPIYQGIRTLTADTERKYVEYRGTTAKEMYYLGADPHELTNKPRNPPAGLVSTLQDLKTCAADTCRAAEDEPQ